VRYGGAKKIYGKDGRELSHESSWMARAIREQREFGGQEIVIGRPDGTRVTVLAHASALRDEAGNVIGGVNVLIDIDERKRAEDVQAFLANVSVALGEIADYEATLERIAEPRRAAFRRLVQRARDASPAARSGGMAVRHLDPRRERKSRSSTAAIPRAEGSPTARRRVLTSGKPIFATDFDAILRGSRATMHHLKLLQRLGLKLVHVRADALRAATSSARSRSRPRNRSATYTDVHFRAAEDLATGAAAAIENAACSSRRSSRPTGARTSSSRCSRTSFATPSPRAKCGPDPSAPRAKRGGELGARRDRAPGAADVAPGDDLLDVSRIASGKIELRRERLALSTSVANAVEASRPAIERGRH
jgi:hypothetical protein